MRVYANCRVRRIFFSDRSYNDWELPHCLRVDSHTASGNGKLGSEPQQQAAQHKEHNTIGQAEEEDKRQPSTQAVRVAEVMVL